MIVVRQRGPWARSAHLSLVVFGLVVGLVAPVGSEVGPDIESVGIDNEEVLKEVRRALEPRPETRALRAPAVPEATGRRPDPDAQNRTLTADEADPTRGPAWSPFEVDNRIVEKRDEPGALVNAANSWRVIFRPLASGGVTLRTLRGQQLLFRAAEAADVKPQIDSGGTSVSYPEVWPGVDVQYVVTDNRVEENIVVKRPGTQSRFPFEIRGGELRAAADGGHEVLIESPLHAGDVTPGEMRIDPVVVLDRGGSEVAPERTGEKALARTRERRSRNDTASDFTISVADAFLAALPADQFPITIDPGVTLDPVALLSSKLGRDPYSPNVGGVNLSTGTYTFTETDGSVAAVGMPLKAERTFNSRWWEAGFLTQSAFLVGWYGPGWTSELQKAAVELPPDADGETLVEITHGDRRTEYFRKETNGTYTPMSGSTASLSGSIASGTLHLVEQDGTDYSFAANPIYGGSGTPHTLSSVVDPLGHVTQYSYILNTANDGYRLVLTDVVSGRTLTFRFGLPSGANCSVAPCTGWVVQSIETQSVAGAGASVWSFKYKTNLGIYSGLPLLEEVFDPANPDTGQTTDKRVKYTWSITGLAFPYISLREDRIGNIEAAYGVQVATLPGGTSTLRVITAIFGSTLTGTWDPQYPPEMWSISYNQPSSGPESMITTTRVGIPTNPTVEWGFDTNLRLVRRRDEQSKTRYWNYDSASGLLDEVRFEDDVPTGVRARETYTYDTNRNQKTVTDRYGATTYYNYDSLNRLTELRDPRSTPATTNPPTTTDNRFLTTTSYQGTTRRIATVTPPSPLTTTTNTYTNGTTDAAYPSGIAPAGLLKSSTNQLGGVTNYLYFANGDLFRRSEPSGLVSEYTYDELGRERFRAESGPGISDGSGTGLYSGPQVFETGWDKNSRIVLTKEPMVPAHDGEPAHRLATGQSYDANGNPSVRLEVDYGSGTTIVEIVGSVSNTYDTLDREKSTITVQGGVATPKTTEYDDRGYVKAVVDEEGRRYEATRDPRGNIDKVILKSYQADPDANSTPFDLTILDADHDWVDRRIADTDAEGRRIEFSLFDVGDRPGRVTLKSYDPVPTSLGGPGGAPVDVVLEDNVYDDAGHLLSMIEGNGKKRSAWTYYNAGLKKDEEIATWSGTAWTTNRRTEWTYDGAGNQTKEVKKALGVAGISDRETRTRYTTAGFTDQSTIEMGSTDIVTTHTQLDARGNPRVTEDPGGFLTDTQYDPIGRPIAVLSPTVTNESNGGTPTASRPTLRYAYTTRGDVSREIDANGRTTVTTYDELRRKATVAYPTYTPPGGSSITPTEVFTYDKVGNLKTSKDRRDKTSTFDYDKLNRVFRATTPGTLPGTPAVARTRYDKVGNTIYTRDPNGGEIIFTYDKLNRQRTKVETVNLPTLSTATTVTDYDLLDNPVWTRDPDGFVATATYNAAGDKLTSVDQLNAVTGYTPSPFGETIRTIEPGERCLATTFDAAGRPTLKNIRGGTNCNNSLGDELFEYDTRGNLLQTTSRDNRKVRNNYDAASRLTSVIDGYQATDGSTTTSIFYDPAGNQTRVRDGRGNDTITTYQPWNLPETTRAPVAYAGQTQANREWTTSYDGGGNVTKETQPGGVTLTRTLDEAGRPLTETATGASGGRTFTYDVGGRPTSIFHPTAAVTVSYNQRNQPLTIAGGASTTNYTYNLRGLVTQRVDAAGTTNLTYNNAGLPLTQTDPMTGGTARYYYDLNQRPVARALYPAGQTPVPDPPAFGVPIQFTTFDSWGRRRFDITLANYFDVFSGTYQEYREYYRTGDGDVYAENISGVTVGTEAGIHTYTYQNGRRLLKSWKNPQNVTTNYTYDENGNRTGAGAATFAYDAQNRLTSGGGNTYTWSDRGTMTSITPTSGTATTLTHDIYNQQLTATTGATTTSLTYDGVGRIAARNGTAFKYSGLGIDPVSEGNWLTIQTADGQPLSLKKGNTSRWADTDAHGDLTGLLTVGGTFDNTAGFDPWGTKTGSTGTLNPTTGFQSDFTDPTTGDVWMGARHYKPSIASFSSRDTVGGELQTPLSLNRYTYGQGNPLGMIDPDGHAPNPAAYGSRSDYIEAVDKEIANHRWSNGVWFRQVALGNGSTESDFSRWWLAYQANVLDPAYARLRAAAWDAWSAAHPSDGGGAVDCQRSLSCSVGTVNRRLREGEYGTPYRGRCQRGYHPDPWSHKCVQNEIPVYGDTQVDRLEGLIPFIDEMAEIYDVPAILIATIVALEGGNFLGGPYQIGVVLDGLALLYNGDPATTSVGVGQTNPATLRDAWRAIGMKSIDDFILANLDDMQLAARISTDPRTGVRAVATIARYLMQEYDVGTNYHAVAMLWAMGTEARAAYAAGGFNLDNMRANGYKRSLELLTERDRYQLPSSYRLARLAGV